MYHRNVFNLFYQDDGSYWLPKLSPLGALIDDSLLTQIQRLYQISTTMNFSSSVMLYVSFIVFTDCFYLS
jgi:hypothetical protein